MQGRFSEIEALIVGAGPTGLMAATELAARGVSLRIVDRAPLRSDKSRALAVQARSLELLQRHGLSDELISTGRKALRAEFFVEGKPLAEIAIGEGGGDDSPFPFALFVSQVEAERIFENKLRSLGKIVERPVELLTCLDAGDCVVATLRHQDGRQELVRARYLIGCDGVHSSVRRAAGIRFEGAPYHQDFVVADVEIDWETPWQGDSIRLFLPARGVLAVFPFRELPGCRIIAAGPRLSTEEVHAPSLAQMQAMFNQLSPLAARLDHARSLARFRLHHRVAERYRRGRVFLAGDAAHVHSPTGGQGMNAGLEDAMNLGWKLALVLAGRAREGFLDSYEEERRPVAQKRLRFTDRLFAVSASSSPVISRLRNAGASLLIPRLASSPSSWASLFRIVSQLDIRYVDSSIVAEDMTLADGFFRRGPCKGSRAPDGPIALASGAGTSLLARLTGATFHLVLFGVLADYALSLYQLVKRRLPAACRDLLRIHLIIGEELGEMARFPTSIGVYEDAPREVCRRYGITRMGLYLVRPDGYVGYRSAGPSVEGLVSYVQTINAPRQRPGAA